MAYKDDAIRGTRDSELEKTIKQYYKAIEESRRQQELIGIYNFSDPDHQGEERNIEGYKQEIDRIRDELHRRNAVRVEKSKQEEAKVLGTGRRENGGNKALQTQIADWFRKQRLEQPASVRITWVAEEREYVAAYSMEKEQLEVWIIVADGTLGADRQGGKSYMRCNTFEEQRAANIAESRRRPSHSAPRKTGPRRAEG